MRKATKVRLYPTNEQKQLLAQQFGCSRFWWNKALGLQYTYRSEQGRWLKRTELNAMLPKLKIELPWLADCYSQVLQATTKHLEQAMKNWFEGRAKKPRFKAKKNKQSISFPQNVKAVGNYLKVPKIGLVEAKFTKPIEGTIKTVTISVTPSGKYYAAIGLDLGDEFIEQSTNGVITGIDLGLKDYVTCHNGTDTYSVKHPKWLKKQERNLRYQQKKLSRRKKGSNRRNKARLLVARVYERLSNARIDFLHKLSHQITDESQVVVVENLNIKGMVKNRKLSKAIAQSGWGMFLNFLSYKLEHKGGVLVEIDRFFPSSKTCSNCGHIHKELELKDREWTCQQCSTHHLRDDNASRNIRTEGIRILGLGHSPRGDDVRLEACFEQLSVKRVPSFEQLTLF
ncbi:MAG: RNA-guided endonuclease InsQ/TnpB family protein [Waterburya sp.]